MRTNWILLYQHLKLRVKHHFQNLHFIPYLYISTFISLLYSLIAKHIEARSFLHRQIWHSIKLYKNILRFSGLLSDSKLRSLALDSLLNRYIMLGFQCSGTDNSLRRIKAVSVYCLYRYG